MNSTGPNPYEALTVREAMDRIGLNLFPDQWTGKEYLDHWRLGLSRWPPTKLRGMQAVQELLQLVWAGRVSVEVELVPGQFGPPPFEVRHFHGPGSMCAGPEEEYHPCSLRFLVPLPSSSGAGRHGYDYAPTVIRILTYLDEHGTSQSAKQITHSIRAEMERAGSTPPSYSRLQPYVSALLAYRVTREQKIPD